jgi:tetratricopeptide (TPR) repeat protein
LRALLEAAYSGALSSTGDVDAALEHSREGARFADLSGDDGVKLALRAALVYGLEIAGRPVEAVRLTEEALARPPRDLKLGAGSLGFSPYVFLVLFRGEMLTHLGRLPEARESLERALTLAEELDEHEIQAIAHGFFGYFARCHGDPEIARRHVPEALRISERMGSALARSFAYRGLGGLHLMDERWEDAIAMFETALDVARSQRTTLWAEPYTLSDLAECHLELGRSDEALEMAEAAVSLAARLRSKSCEAHARLALARVALAVGREAAIGRVEALIAQSESELHAMGATTFLPHVSLLRAKLARERGDFATARREFAEAHRRFTEIGAEGYAKRAAAEIGGMGESPIVASIDT